MATLISFEAQVKAEYGAISAFIALHPRTCIIVAVIAACAFGHLRWPV